MNEPNFNTSQALNVYATIARKTLFMRHPLKIIFFAVIVFNLILASWYVLHGDLFFHSDIARDFMLLHELETKKIILIGARTGAAGVYHGVFWYYLMFPAYFLSGGNPVAVGWFWIFLVVLFLFGNFQIAKRLFDQKTAYLSTLLVSTFVVFLTRALTHTDGTWLLSPFFFFFFVRYNQTLKAKYLAVAVLLSGLLIHLELVVGIPVFSLTLIWVFALALKKEKLAHLLAFILILIPLSTYIFFELRHNFSQLRNILGYINQERHQGEGLKNILVNRIDYMTTSAAQFIQNNQINKIIFAFFAAIFAKTIYKSKSRSIYLISLYFFLGFFVFSLISPFYLLRHHFMAFVPIVFMVFAALAAGKYGKLLLPILVICLITNELSAVNFVKSSQNFIGKDKNSWKLLNKISSDIFEKSNSEFGYFVYSPDLLGYAPKYAMIYAQKTHPGIKGSYFTKKPQTFVMNIATGFDPNNPLVEAWPRNAINLRVKPASQVDYPNGYSVVRFELSPEDVAAPFNKDLDTGLLYR